MVLISTTVDGTSRQQDVEPRLLLVHYLRTALGRTGTVIGCDTSNCGACTVLLDGLSVKSCTVLAVQADGTEITTIQGLAEGELHPVQKAFHENHALQCGYCTAGMIMSAVDLLMDNRDPTEREVRDGLEGNLCRCTGYQNIVTAVRAAAAELRAETSAPEGETGLGGQQGPGRDRPEDALMRDLAASGPDATLPSDQPRPAERYRS
jgi:carbon-monoxide dehydrogenase small subunit